MARRVWCCSLPIPTVWRNGDFAADLSAFVPAAPCLKRQASFVELAVQQELQGWAEPKYPSPTLFRAAIGWRNAEYYYAGAT